MTTIEKKYTVTDILVEKESIETFTCSICFEAIHNKEIYQCKEGHWNCRECWTSSLKNKKECMTCRVKVNSIEDLSRNRFLETEFSLKKVYCPNLFLADGDCISNSIDKENGCNELLTVDKLGAHLLECKSRFVKCEFSNCNSIIRFNQLSTHIEKCDFNQQFCKFCKKNNIPKSKLSKHQEKECPNYKIKCTQNCEMELERCLLKSHISETCPMTLIPCMYSNYGCISNGAFTRSELSNHLNSTDHSKYMNELILKHDLELKESNSNNKLLLVKLNNMEALISKQSEIINKLITTPPTTKTPGVSKYINRWTISNYLKSKVFQVTQRLTSPLFEIVGKKFEVAIYPTGYNSEHTGYLSAYLFLKTIDSTLTVSYSITLLNQKDSRKNVIIKSEQVFSSSNPGWGRGKLIKSDEVSKSNGWLDQYDRLTILFEVEILNRPTPFETNMSKK